MANDENREAQLVNDGKVPENGLLDPEIEHRQKKNPSIPISYDQSQGEMKASDVNSDDGKAGDEIPEQNGEEDRNLTNNEPHELLMKEKDDQVVDEQSVDVPDQNDNDDQSDSERTEVDENGIEGVVSVVKEEGPATPSSLMRCSNENDSGDKKGLTNNWLESELMEDDKEGSSEEQKAFMKELQCFYSERAMEFKPPKFYQQPVNCLKLWRAVIKLGGYDVVSGHKFWRQIGESFHPPKTCTTTSWTFRNIYEKALLEYERYKCQNGDLQFPAGPLPESSSIDNYGNGYQGSGLSARIRRDSASRAMQGWHVQKLSGNGKAGGESAIKDKNFNDMPRREKSLKSLGSVKHKRPTEMDHTIKTARTELGKQLVIAVEDAGPSADWVKINVLEAKDCFEVYALVPGLLREEVRVQSDPAGRLVITGQPEQPDNPWGITPFKKVVNFPARIDPLQTSAVVSLHGKLYVRVPFEESDN